MDWRSVGVMSLCGALIILKPNTSAAHLAHPGYSGLISTPNAEAMPQGKLGIAMSWIDGPETYLFRPKTNRIYAVTIGILPGLEVTLRQTQVIGWHDPDAPGVKHALDRMVSSKLSLPMPAGYPALAIGIQDIASGNLLTGVRGVIPGATQYGQTTLYAVLGDNYQNWGWHGGIGASQAFINGPFAGIIYHRLEQLWLLGEWDSKGINLGLRVTPVSGLWLQISHINRKTLGISANINVSL